MKVLLKKTIDRTGRAGEEVIVKDGYARNFLIPNNLAIAVNSVNKILFEKQKQKLLEEEKQRLSSIEEINTKLQDVALTFSLKSNASGKLFGSVTPTMLINALAKEGIDLKRKDLQLEENLKTLGEHKVQIQLLEDYVTEIKVTIDLNNSELPESDKESTELPDTKKLANQKEDATEESK